MIIGKSNISFNNKAIILLIIFSLLFFIVNAHEEEEKEVHEEKIELGSYLKSTSLNYLLIASVIVLILVLFSIFYKEKTKIKMFLFFGIITPVILATIYLAASTIYLNLISETQGPVHWHADYEIWNCNEKIELIKPEGLSNRIGSPLFHDHGDNRIHVEGVVTNANDINLHNFFETVGGYMSKDTLKIPTDKEFIEIKNKDLCNGKGGKLQVFLYKVKNPEDIKNWVFEQLKLENFENYILAPHSNVPPGDCIIIEFDEEKEKTELLCDTYESAVRRAELSGS